MTREERRNLRIERYKELSAKNQSASTAAYNRSKSLVANIPLGQPILVGHYSESSHRNTLQKSWNALGQSVKLSEKSDYYANKADAAESNNAIYLEDENSIEKLQQKIDSLTEVQEFMKSANKICKNKKLSDEQKIDKLMNELNLTESKAKHILSPDCFGNVGFASFSLTNNSAKIRNTKKQLEAAKALRERETKEYQINGITVIENTELNRFQIFFNYKPNEEIRKQLKQNGFRWSPSEGAWQSSLKRWYIDRGRQILEAL